MNAGHIKAETLSCGWR